MIEDRYYMRRPTGGVYRSATFTLIVLNVVLFVLELWGSQFFPTTGYLALSSDGLRSGYVWQLLTFQFMHANLMHLVFNCLAIYLFGSQLEEAVGRRSFWILYLSSGVVGGLLQASLGIVLKGSFQAPVVGASAGAYGLTAAFALLFPDIRLFPIPIRAKHLLPISAIIALVFMFVPSAGGGNVAHAAHFGGLVAGYLFVKYAVHWNFRWPQFGRVRRPPLRRLVKVPAQKAGTWREAEAAEEDGKKQD